MGKLQDEQPAFDRAICDAMVASISQDWNVIVLTMERSEGSTAIGELSHTISSPDHNRSAMPDDSLYEATYCLDELFQRHGAVLRRAVYRVELLSDSWEYTANFEIDEPAKKDKQG
jgi:hypothetical protein